MRESYLIQRLDRPHGGKGDNPFSFGGGMKNGGLSDEAMDLLRGIFSFDYMGSAEFEYGAVPKALREIAGEVEGYGAWCFTFPLADVAPHWKHKDEEPPSGQAAIFVIARPEWRKEIEKRIRTWARKPYGSHLKEVTRLDAVLRPPTPDPYPVRTAGWLELDNGFFFFTDEAMWCEVARLFGVKELVS